MSAQKRYPLLTHEAVAEARALMGQELPREQWRSEASLDAIWQFARSIGSRNSLYQDPNYAVDTFYDTLVAHPTFLYAVDDTFIAPKLPGIQAIYGGTDWEFEHPVRLGDTIRANARLVDVQEKEGRFCGRMVLQVGEVKYRNQHDQVVAMATSYVLRTPRDEARARGKYKEVKRAQYTNEQMAEIADSYDEEQVRGSTSRHWEEVEVGEKLIPVVKGPLTSEDMRHFINTVRGTKALDYFVTHMRLHPEDVYWDPVFNMPDSWEACLIKDEVAQEFGFPAACDIGYQRICWLENMVTNWMGDLGFLSRLSARSTRPNILSDTTWCYGKVSSKHTEGSSYLADLDIWCQNQRQEVTAQGTAKVWLPSRDPKAPPPLVRYEA